jgi:phage shock protein C
MYCTKCGAELREQDNFCSRCGIRTAACAVAAPRVQPLMLDKRNKKIAGVCAGFARYFNMDIVLMRVIWLALAIGTGVGFLVYLAAWIAIPSDRGVEPPMEMTQIPQRS